MTKSLSSLEKLIADRDLVILGGAMGTELQRRGYKTTLPLWSASANLDAIELVEEIHNDYFDAGADICITNTFRTTPRTFKKLGRELEAHDALKKSVAAAQKAQNAAKRQVLCGGSVAPLEDCYRPDLVPSLDELEHEHGQLAEWLAAEGVDFILAETINEIKEAGVMARAASATGLPFIISFVVDGQAQLLDGSSIEDVIKATDVPGRVAISLNCRAIDIIDTAFNKLNTAYNGAVGLYPNGFGHPHDDEGWIFEDNDDSTEKFVQYALKWNEKGAKIIGGCCGATPAYIRALYEAKNK
jgi:S-methylmethionine-dependent homocysteine/selenocysteine methylase